jgi:hypothetical protein
MRPPARTGTATAAAGTPPSPPASRPPAGTHAPKGRAPRRTGTAAARPAGATRYFPQNPVPLPPGATSGTAGRPSPQSPPRDHGEGRSHLFMATVTPSIPRVPRTRQITPADIANDANTTRRRHGERRLTPPPREWDRTCTSTSTRRCCAHPPGTDTGDRRRLPPSAATARRKPQAIMCACWKFHPRALAALLLMEPGSVR